VEDWFKFDTEVVRRMVGWSLISIQLGKLDIFTTMLNKERQSLFKDYSDPWKKHHEIVRIKKKYSMEKHLGLVGLVLLGLVGLVVLGLTVGLILLGLVSLVLLGLVGLVFLGVVSLVLLGLVGLVLFGLVGLVLLGLVGLSLVLLGLVLFGMVLVRGRGLVIRAGLGLLLRLRDHRHLGHGLAQELACDLATHTRVTARAGNVT
jgi:hypothetical protein